ncbi:ferrous iron transport protein B [Hathewaya limosa]|uniref:Ferrous iron transport protein B n=1 Tax=Hathewaya limosa TaxID=1536 RepID=A0ABU0JQK7_HATLI|nr:ferrous iron transport protein B [Hathewaya limosa]AWZ48064.1 ferrous iron transport protein B [Clostridiaceae bacterium 14S0207]MDQ0479376.1 ferrous iron transport protein B [Hathewaya limosa]
MGSEIVVALMGNPNCGKTSLFNALTGARQHVGNWPGVTVEKKEGKLKYKGKTLRIVDLPGTYSLSAYSEDEVVARDYLVKEKPHVVIDVVDGTNLERNMYLTTQIMEIGCKVVMSLNMMDEVEKRNIKIDAKSISQELDVEVVPTIAARKKGINDLLDTILKIADKAENNKELELEYDNDFQGQLKEIIYKLDMHKDVLDYPSKWTAVKLIENDSYMVNYITEKGLKDVLKQVEESINYLTKVYGFEPENVVVDKRYEYIGKILNGKIQKQDEYAETVSDKIDKVVTNKYLGLPIFALIMFIMYQITMSFGNDYLGEKVGQLFEILEKYAEGALSGASPFLSKFITEGLIDGLGQVLTFVPLILVMYLIIGILEDSGYMARAAYVMDRFMSSLGLHGKTAVSMIIGSGCNVAGIMSTRTLESKKDRMIAILVNPFISCSARMPVYATFAAAFFTGKKFGFLSVSGLVIFSLYLIGILVAIICAKIFSKTLFKGEKSYFLMELPPYRIPTVKGVLLRMWEKASAFFKKAGTIIFAIVVVVWVLSNLPMNVEPGSAQSVLGKLGSIIAPIFKPLGFGTWQAGVALITGVLAKEAVLATMATVYAVSEEALGTALGANFTALTAYTFMVFTLLYSPCMAALGTVKKETNSHKWAIFSAVYTTVIAWVICFLIYNIGKLFV